MKSLNSDIYQMSVLVSEFFTSQVDQNSPSAVYRDSLMSSWNSFTTAYVKGVHGFLDMIPIIQR